MTMSGGRSVLVTGGTGHVGACLCRRLLTGGDRVAVLSRPGADRSRLSGVDGIAILNGSLTEARSVAAAVDAAAPDVVFHLAGTPFNPPTHSLADHVQVNVNGAANLVAALQGTPARVVYTSSAAIYGPGPALREDRLLAPGTWVGAVKAAAGMILEANARMSGGTLTELRLFTPFGPMERPGRLVPSVILAALDGRPVRTTAGLQRRDFVFIDDVVDALMRAGGRTQPGVLIANIGSGTGVSVREMVSLILRLMGDPVPAEFGALPSRPDEIPEITADISAAFRLLGWRPQTDLETGVAQTIAWFRTHAEFARRLT